MNKTIKRAAAILAAAVLATPAFAAQETFNLAWSGATFGNDAKATGEITIDTSAINSSYTDIMFPDSRVSDLSVTISGARTGNGTFGLSDFSFAAVWAPSPLDFSKELVGQSLTTGGTWGQSNAMDGDFNLFAANPSAPNGTWYFELTTSAGGGDTMALTSMTPVPETSNVALMLAGLGLVGVVARRRKAQA
jgi:hypothetical protein